MLAFLYGRVVEKTPQLLVLQVGGVGYSLLISATTYAALAAVGEEVQIRTYLYVRESILQLFGFATDKERDLFLELLSVSGVGPKLALTILSSAPVDQLYRTLAEGQEVALTRISGLGKKTAQRLLLDLKDKSIARLKQQPEWSIAGSRLQPVVADQAIQALSALGFSLSEAQLAVQAALAELDSDATVEKVIQSALNK